jgi:menaquinone-dependent protoporphyrinogen oxidase
MSVLVGYASAHGSTREIAQRVARRLEENGLQVETRSVDQVTSLDGYDAYVLGSAVHNGAWLPDAVKFVTDNRAVLAGRPLWLFSVGSKDSLRGPLGRRLAANYPIPKGIAELQEDLRPRDHRILTGVIRKEQYPGFSRVFVWAMGGHYGDFRDWPAIDAWAADIATALAATRHG